jgi:hypothetical protein
LLRVLLLLVLQQGACMLSLQTTAAAPAAANE